VNAALRKNAGCARLTSVAAAVGALLLVFLTTRSAEPLNKAASDAVAKPRQSFGLKGSLDAAGKFTPQNNSGATNLLAPKTQAEAEKTLREALGLSQTGPDTFTIGRLALNRKERAVTIPARVNMNREVVEYALVSETGKQHESVFTTEVRPDQAHLAALLLGVTPAAMPADAAQPVEVPSTNAVQIEVTWKTSGVDARHSLAALILIKTTPGSPGKPMPGGDWFYNGLTLGESGFAAQLEGSFISLITDASALVNNPRPDRANDDLHFPNDRLLPPVGTPVEIILRFKPLGSAAPPPGRSVNTTH